jgi:Family of unknown function (DUF5681)
MSKKYEVGYGKPPKHSQFKKGQSGNPKGRRKGSRNLKTDVKDTLKQRVRLTKDGKPKTVSTQQAALLRLREKALAGDSRSLDRLIELARLYNDDELAEAASELTGTDADILEGFKERLLRKEGKSKAEYRKRSSSEPEAGTPPEDDKPADANDDDDWLK